MTKPLMLKQGDAQSDKRCPVQVLGKTKALLDNYRTEYNATHDQVIRNLIKFYEANKG